MKVGDGREVLEIMLNHCKGEWNQSNRDIDIEPVIFSTNIAKESHINFIQRRITYAISLR